MKRRQFLAGVAATSAIGVAGCGEMNEQSEETETDSRWPTETNDPSPEATNRSWEGAADSVSVGPSKLVLDGVTVSPLFAKTTQQVGVSTENAERDNIEDMPESKYRWYEAPSESYFWLVYVDLLYPHNRHDPDVLPDGDLWRLQPRLEEDDTPTSSFSSTFTPDPTYYRVPAENGRDSTSYAYTNPGAGANELRVLAFESPSNTVELLYGDPVEAAWNFSDR